jgi:hypothetical protein
MANFYSFTHLMCMRKRLAQTTKRIVVIDVLLFYMIHFCCLRFNLISADYYWFDNSLPHSLLSIWHVKCDIFIYFVHISQTVNFVKLSLLCKFVFYLFFDFLNSIFFSASIEPNRINLGRYDTSTNVYLNNYNILRINW